MLAEVLDEIRAAPRSAAGLTLYALVSTLEQSRAGALFKLEKLRDLTLAQRRLAYGLMELMADGGIGDEDWRSAKAAMDDAVRRA